MKTFIFIIGVYTIVITEENEVDASKVAQIVAKNRCIPYDINAVVELPKGGSYVCKTQNWAAKL
jgi:hypothetical protein